jgi:argininosuccinate lyase
MSSREPPKDYRALFFTEELLPEIKHAIQSERARPLMAGYHAFDKAHAVMLVEQGLVERSIGTMILGALREMEASDVVEARTAAGGGAHSGEAYISRRHDEEAGGSLNLGRSSGDLGTVAVRIAEREKLLALMASINAIREALLQLASRHLHTVMAGYTFGQHTQPITLGHLAVAYESSMARDFDRADQAYGRVNLSPAGAAIMAGSDFPIDRQRTSDLMGFDEVVLNTHDSIAGHDHTLETFWVVAIISADLGRMADDVMFLASNEIGLIDVPDRYSGTSSIAPQKKNPYAPQFVKGGAANAVGGLVTAFQVDKGPSLFAMLDRSYTTKALWAAADDTIRHLAWMADLLATMEVRTALAKERAGAYWAQATDVAGAVVREAGIPWRAAHQVVGLLVRDCQRDGVSPHDVTPAMVDAVALSHLGMALNIPADALARALDPEQFVEARTLAGGPAPSAVETQIAEERSRLTAATVRLTERRQRLDTAATRLEAAIDDILRSDPAE